MRATQVLHGAKAPPENPYRKTGPTPPKTERLAKKRERFQKRAVLEEKRESEAVSQLKESPGAKRRKSRRI